MAQRTKPKSQAKQSSQPDSPPQQQTFIEHLYELRSRVFWVVLTLVLATIVGLQIKDWLIEVAMAPLGGQKLIYLTPGGGFSFIFTLSLYFGALLTIPVAVLQLFRFLQPMLPRTSRKFLVIFMSVSTLLTVAGASLAYFLAVPAALGFLDGFAGSSVTASLTADAYLNFLVVYVVGLAALFQIPLLLFLYDHIKPIPPGSLARSQRYAIVAMTIFAALITPSPDLISFAIVLIPILAIYEIGVLTVYIRRQMRKNQTGNVQSVLEPVAPTQALEVDKRQAEPLTATIVDELDRIHEDLLHLEIDETEGEIDEVAPSTHQEQTETVMKPEPVLVQSKPVAVSVAQPAAKPVRSVRSIDGIRAAHKTTVKVSKSTAANTSPKKPQKSIDGVLTAQAQA